MVVQVRSFKDFDKNVVKIGDRIEAVDIVTGEKLKDLGVVKRIEKSGYIVTPITDIEKNRNGRHTRKV